MKTTLFAATAMAALTIVPAAASAAGHLMIYTSTPSDAMTALIAKFNEAQPDVAVEFFRSGTTEVINKLEAELAAGDPQPDVLLLADTTVMQRLENEGRLQAYPEAPVAGLPDGFVDPDMTWFGTKLISTGIMWNTEMGVPAPTSWADLTAAAANGQVIMASPLYSGAAVIHVGTVTAQPDFGWAYYEKLADAGAVAGQGNGTVLDAVANGQKAYGIIVDYMPLNAKAQGSPVDFVYPSEGVSVVTEPVAITANAKDPAAARVFVDWLLSDAGQAYMAEQGYIPAKPGVAAPAGRPAASELRLMPVTAEQLLETIEPNKKQFADLFGG